MEMIDHDGRGTEWLTSALKIGAAIQLARPKDTLNLATYAGLQEMGVSEFALALVLLFFGVVHIAALIVNGRWKRTPQWRGFCCLVGAVIFTGLAYVTWLSPTSAPGLLPVFFTVLIIFEIVGCRRAGADDRCSIPL
ncbi:hypothetical protein [Paracoccus beibuensis]|uniref:hypothetical protein n=1 Tax=Paracoccus beibuensis TaxID=547602 RepID=UPI00223EFBFD|nr:hypothetical protein [Paracoccus beibuensis]